MLDTIARKILPTKVRQTIGSSSLRFASLSPILLKPYLYLVHGYTMKNLKLKGKDAIYYYEGKEIRAPKDGIGSFFGVFQEEVYDRVLKPIEGDVVIDIGAYVGEFTIKAALQVGMFGIVVAVEPDILNFEYLKRNSKDLTNLILVREPLSNEVKDVPFYLSSATSCHSLVYKQKTRINMTTDTLDNLVKSLPLPRVNFIKIDAEGSEFEVLQGAKDTLKNKGIKLAIASYHTSPEGGPEAPKIIRFLKDRGFKVETDSGLRRYIYAYKIS